MRGKGMCPATVASCARTPAAGVNRSSFFLEVAMKYRFSCVLALGAALGFFPAPGLAQHYVQKNLVSDVALPNNADGTPVQQVKTFLNPWGITRSSTSPWWPSGDTSGLTSLLTG